MKKLKLLSLDEIQLDSFVTTVGPDQAQEIEGGTTPVLYSIATSSEPCVLSIGVAITYFIC